MAALALLPAGTPLPVAASGPRGPQEPKLLFHPICQQRLGALVLGSGLGWLPTQAVGGIWGVGVARPVAARAQPGAALEMPWGCSCPEPCRWPGWFVGDSRMCWCLACLVPILSPRVPNHPSTAGPQHPEMPELPGELLGCRTSLLSAVSAAKQSPGSEDCTWEKGQAGGGGGQRVVPGVKQCCGTEGLQPLCRRDTGISLALAPTRCSLGLQINTSLSQSFPFPSCKPWFWL